MRYVNLVTLTFDLSTVNICLLVIAHFVSGYYMLLIIYVRTHNSTATTDSLVARPGANPVPVVCSTHNRNWIRSGTRKILCSGVPLCVLHSTGVPVWQPAANIRDRRCLRSADTTTLQVPSTRRAALGNRAFMVAAARAWNNLPPGHSTRGSGLLLAFDILKGDQVSPFLSDLTLSTLMVNRRLRWAVQQFWM